MTFMDS